MEEPFGILIASLALTVCLAALFAAVSALFPVTVEMARRSADDQPSRSFWLGLVNLLFVTGLTVLLLSISQGPVLRFLAMVVAAAGFIILTLGLAAVCGLVGERLAPHRSGLGRIVLGTVVMTLGSITPLVGWFGLFPYAAFLGAGGFIISFFRRRSNRPTMG
ncbi:MAG TPA: hypothetical protein VFI11_14290 [Anaerolineales bacterium]|nr:hypothetical protein [Anaerolineales bacterium]